MTIFSHFDPFLSPWYDFANGASENVQMNNQSSLDLTGDVNGSTLLGSPTPQGVFPPASLQYITSLRGLKGTCLMGGRWGNFHVWMFLLPTSKNYWVLHFEKCFHPKKWSEWALWVNISDRTARNAISHRSTLLSHTKWIEGVKFRSSHCVYTNSSNFNQYIWVWWYLSFHPDERYFSLFNTHWHMQRLLYNVHTVLTLLLHDANGIYVHCFSTIIHFFLFFVLLSCHCGSYILAHSLIHEWFIKYLFICIYKWEHMGQ